MSTDPASVAREFYDHISAGRLEQAMAMAAPDYVGHGPGGYDGLRAELRTWAAAFPDLVIEVEELIAQSDLVAVRMRLTGTHTGTFAGVPASGRRFEVRATDVLRIAEGQVAEAWPLFDLAGLLVQLGATPAERVGQ